MPHTLGLWRNVSFSIAFILVVDNFGVKYLGKKQANHLFNALKKSTKLQRTEQEGCIVSLIWNVITSPARSILTCLATSKHNSNGKNMTDLPAPSTPPTLWRQDNISRVHWIQSHTIKLQPQAPTSSSASNRLW